MMKFMAPTRSQLRTPSVRHQLRTTPVRRAGAALVELSVCLPVLMLLVLGSIEAAHAIYLKQTLVTAAYEAIRESTDRSATTASAIAKGQLILDQRSIQSASFSFNPSNVATAPRGSLITVTVTAPCQSNMPIATRFLTAPTLSVQATMAKEGLN